MFYCLGPGVQYLADNRLLLDPLVSPLHPLQLHLPRRLGAHQEVKGKSRSNPHGTITPRSLARVFDPADIDRIGILVNIAPIRLQEEEKKDSNPTPSPVPIWQSYSPKLCFPHSKTPRYWETPDGYLDRLTLISARWLQILNGFWIWIRVFRLNVCSDPMIWKEKSGYGSSVETQN